MDFEMKKKEYSPWLKLRVLNPVVMQVSVIRITCGLVDVSME